MKALLSGGLLALLASACHPDRTADPAPLPLAPSTAATPTDSSGTLPVGSAYPLVGSWQMLASYGQLFAADGSVTRADTSSFIGLSWPYGVIFYPDSTTEDRSDVVYYPRTIRYTYTADSVSYWTLTGSVPTDTEAIKLLSADELKLEHVTRYATTGERFVRTRWYARVH